MSLIVEGREIALDQDGFLVDLADWSEAVAEALAARDRAACGPVCPPQGLYLTGVGYPADPFA